MLASLPLSGLGVALKMGTDIKSKAIRGSLLVLQLQFGKMTSSILAKSRKVTQGSCGESSFPLHKQHPHPTGEQLPGRVSLHGVSG